MKKSIILAALGAFFIFAPPAVAAHDGKHVLVTVNGMVCGFCAQSLKKVYLKNSAVADVDINLESKIVTLSLKDGQNITDEEVSKGIDYAGYSVAKIERD